MRQRPEISWHPRHAHAMAVAAERLTQGRPTSCWQINEIVETDHFDALNVLLRDRSS